MIPKNKEIESALGRLDSIIRTLQSDTKPSLNRLIKSTYPKIELPPSEATKLVKSLEAVEK